MMIIGGIQGDEPGALLSADLYADFSLKRGNLIVVPRANFHSILLFKRGTNGDMNRKFGKSKANDKDSAIVDILKGLIAESDCLLNLHDGWGFYRPTHEGPNANPMRYGQSIIADTKEYFSESLGRTIKLEEIALEVIREVNAQIENPKYHFHFMNTRTGEKSSNYAEQRTSATYYALTNHGIPAFGIETSKNLPSTEMKVRQHNLAINAFMKIFNLEAEQPRIYLNPPKLKYLVISVNGSNPVAVANKETLTVNKGDRVEIVHVEANYERGLSVDIKGIGSINDYRTQHIINKPTFIVARKDHLKFGLVKIDIRPEQNRPERQKSLPQKLNVRYFVLQVNGMDRLVKTNDTLEAIDGDIIRIVDIISEGESEASKLRVNFKGFVPAGERNTGEDRGYHINTATDLLMRYSLSKKEKIYLIVAEEGKKIRARMTIRLKKPSLKYMIIRKNEGPRICLYPGEGLTYKPGDVFVVLDVITDTTQDMRSNIHVEGSVVRIKQVDSLLSFRVDGKKDISLLIKHAGLLLGKFSLTPGKVL